MTAVASHLLTRQMMHFAGCDAALQLDLSCTFPNSLSTSLTQELETQESKMRPTFQLVFLNYYFSQKQKKPVCSEDCLVLICMEKAEGSTLRASQV